MVRVGKQHGRPCMIGERSPVVGAWDASDSCIHVCGPQPTRNKCQQTSHRGRPRQSRRPTLLLAQGASEKGMRLLSSDAAVPKGIAATGEPANTTDEKPALGSVGLTDQVESCRSSLPSSLLVSHPRDLDCSRTIFPVSRGVNGAAVFPLYAL